MKKRVVITGRGLISPVGRTVQDTWDSLINGRSGIAPITAFDRVKYNVEAKIAGQVTNFDIADYFPRAKADSMFKDMDRVSQLCIAACLGTIEESRLKTAFEEGHLDPNRVCSFVGTGIGGIATASDDIYKVIELGPKKVGVRSIFRLMPNAPAGQVGIEFGIMGQAKSISTACASGLDAMLDAYHHISDGHCDAVVVGGSEACLIPLAISSFHNMRALSRRDVPPAEASCPFSAERDGFVMSEGAVMFIMEDRDIALRRGATIYGEVLGGAGTCDAYHITAPHETGEGAYKAIRNALKYCNLNPEDIQYVHAHGTSTSLNDARETMAIKRAFGDHAYKLWVSSTKSVTGHLIGGAGPMGVFAAMQAIATKIVPPTINYRVPDPECDLDYVPNTAREGAHVKHAIVNSLGFGGHNTTLVLGPA